MSVEPHGGDLVDRLVSESEAPLLRASIEDMPAIHLDARELADLELIATGAFSPLTGFLGSADYRRVLEEMRLADGTVWPLPVTLAVAAEALAGIAPGRFAALYDVPGRAWGVLEVSEVFERDPLAEAQAIYRTVDPGHPGVAYLLSRPRWLVAGSVRVLPLPKDLAFASHRLTPRELREAIRERGWKRIAGFQTRNPIHRAHEHLTKVALELTDGLVIHALVGETKSDDVPAIVRFQSYEVLVEKYYPPQRTLLAAFPAAMRYAGPREALFHALVRKNYGITHLIVGRDHAGVGGFYGPYEAHEIFDRFTADEMGATPLKLDATFFCAPCDALASQRTCPHGSEGALQLSGTKVRELLRSGGSVPKEFTRSEVAEVLRRHYDAAGGTEAPASLAPLVSAAAVARSSAASADPAAPGFILWFTGLSGAGKSTLAEALRERLRSDWPVEVLDGDEVRTYISKDLGFSKQDRDTNIRRIGYVARLLARNGVAVIVAAISPYAEARDEVRRLAQKQRVPFVEIFARADIQALIQRDVKGLYEKALAGEIPHFTGVSDPYEPPLVPDVTVRTDQESVEESVSRILAELERLEITDAGEPAREAAAS